MNKPKVRIGILGFGTAGRTMHAVDLAKFPEQFEIVALCDHDSSRRANLPAEFAKLKLYDEIGAFLADPDIDLVTVATRNCDHTPHAVQALDAGKNVVIEKPVAISSAQALELVYASERHPGKLFLRHNRRFEAAFNQVKEIIDSGLLGNVYAVRVHRHPTFARRFDWQTTVGCFGGLLNNWGPHILDQALQLLESPVADLWSDLQHRVATGTAEDYFKVMLRGENGRVVDVEVSGNTTLPDDLYYAEGDRGSLVVPLAEKTVRLKYLDPDFKFTSLHADLGNRRTFDYYGNREVLPMVEKEIPIAPANGRNDLALMWLAVYDAIRNGKPYPIKLEEGLEVIRITEWARNASKFVPHPIPAYE